MKFYITTECGIGLIGSALMLVRSEISNMVLKIRILLLMKHGTLNCYLQTRKYFTLPISPNRRIKRTTFRVGKKVDFSAKVCGQRKNSV